MTDCKHVFLQLDTFAGVYRCVAPGDEKCPYFLTKHDESWLFKLTKAAAKRYGLIAGVVLIFSAGAWGYSSKLDGIVENYMTKETIYVDRPITKRVYIDKPVYRTITKPVYITQPCPTPVPTRDLVDEFNRESFELDDLF